MQATAAAKAASRPRKEDDLIAYLPAQYTRIRRFAAPFLAAFTFEGNRQSREVIDVVMQMTAAGKSRSRFSDARWMHAALDLVDKQWCKAIKAPDGSVDRRMLELFIIVELKNRIGANEIWIKGSRTYRALDEGMISQQTYAIIKAEARIPVAIPVDVDVYLAQKSPKRLTKNSVRQQTDWRPVAATHGSAQRACASQRPKM